MSSTFFARMAELKEKVGQGKISSEIKVNQVYARRQHQGIHLNHPAGGQALFLRTALMSTHQSHYRQVAAELFDGNLRALFIRYAERVARESRGRTPVELGNLKNSDSTKVRERGRVIYRRPAERPRLSRTVLNRRTRHPRNQRHFEGWWDNT